MSWRHGVCGCCGGGETCGHCTPSPILDVDLTNILFVGFSCSSIAASIPFVGCTSRACGLIPGCGLQIGSATWEWSGIIAAPLLCGAGCNSLSASLFVSPTYASAECETHDGYAAAFHVIGDRASGLLECEVFPLGSDPCSPPDLSGSLLGHVTCDVGGLSNFSFSAEWLVSVP